MPRILYLRPGGQPDVRTVADAPESWRTLLDGAHVEQITLSDDLCALVDSNGVTKGLQPCCIVERNVLVGPVVFARYNGRGEIVDLKDADLRALGDRIEPWLTAPGGPDFSAIWIPRTDG